MPEGGDIQTLWLVGIALCMLAAVGVLTWRIAVVQSRLAKVQTRAEALNGTLGAICAGAVGVDRRISMLEKQGRDLAHRQEATESQQQHDAHPYGEAIQLVQQGVSASRLVEELGLTRNEAELVVMVHGMQEAV